MQDEVLRTAMSPMSRGGQLRLERLRAHIQQQQHQKRSAVAISPRSALQQRIREASRLDANDMFFKAFGGAEELEALEFDLVRTEVPVHRPVDSRSSKSRAAPFSLQQQQQQRTTTEPSAFCPTNRYDVALSAVARPRPMLPTARSMPTAIGVLTSNSSLSNHNASAIAAAATSRMSQLARPSSHIHNSPGKRNPLKRLRAEESMGDVENIAPVLQKPRLGRGPASMLMEQSLGVGASASTNALASRLQLGSNFRLPTSVNASRPFALRQAPW